MPRRLLLSFPCPLSASTGSCLPRTRPIQRCPTSLAAAPLLRRSPCTQALGKRLPFAFLADACQHFQARYAAVAPGAVAYEMNTEFAPVLRERMRYFNTDPRWGVGWGGERGAGAGWRARAAGAAGA